jgi:sec-independent protein translocase protein TatB
MFDFSWSELLLIGIVALIFIGPKELPGVLRTLGQWMTKIRRMASDFQNQFHDAMREAELADLKKEVDGMAAQAASYANLDPLADVRKDLESAQREIESAVAGTPAGESSAVSKAPEVGAPTTEPAPSAAVPNSQAPVAEQAGPSRESPAVTATGESVQESPNDPVKEPIKHDAAGGEPA